MLRLVEYRQTLFVSLSGTAELQWKQLRGDRVGGATSIILQGAKARSRQILRRAEIAREAGLTTSA